MSMSVNGQHVMCDGIECLAQADLPIALRSKLGHARATEEIDGWLFVAKLGEWHHYCPNCLPLHLERLSGSFTATHQKT